MIYYKTDEEIEIIRENCLLVCKTLALAGELLKPGVKGSYIDQKAETFIRDHGAIPAFKDYPSLDKSVPNFPTTLCISKNEVVVHGIPSGKDVFEDGDIVSVDCGVEWNGYFGDAAYTFAVGDVPEPTMELLRTTLESLYLGIDNAVLGKRLGDIGFAVQNHVTKHGYTVVRELVGHGIGRDLHEDPQVFNYGRRGQGQKLLSGLVIAIEPMINMGRKDVVTAEDGWTVFAKDRKPSAHYEHTVAVRKNKADILSDHSFIENAIAKNPNLKEIEAMILA